MSERNILRKWIFEHTEEEWRKEVDNFTFVSYPYEKYGEFVLAFKAEGGWNIQFCNLSKEFTDDLYIGYKETLLAVKYLGERIELALNFFNGKTNEEIEKALNEKQITIRLPQNVFEKMALAAEWRSIPIEQSIERDLTTLAKHQASSLPKLLAERKDRHNASNGTV